jgi:hypothetical protein
MHAVEGGWRAGKAWAHGGILLKSAGAAWIESMVGRIMQTSM